MGNTAIIFDLDGTLVDTLADIAAAMNHVLEQSGLPTHSVEAYKNFIGMGARVLVHRALPASSDHDEDRYLDAFRERYVSHLTERSAPYPGIPELLRKLQERGYPMSVLSNKPHEPTQRLVAALFPASVFYTVQGHRTGVALKPEPAEALRLCREMSARRCVFVGDSEVDMKTARAASMTAIGVAWGLRPPDALKAAGADVIIEKPEQLLELIAD